LPDSLDGALVQWIAWHYHTVIIRLHFMCKNSFFVVRQKDKGKRIQVTAKMNQM